jgi:5'-nucleotidase
MHILVTNDDGVFAPGLLALAQALQPLGQVSILAPDRNWSASGHVKTLERPLRVKEVLLPGGLRAFASDGAPSDCVALGIMGVLDQPVDLVVSGINPNANVGHDVTYSGTVTAAMEGAINGLPALAFSLDSRRENGQPHFADAAAVAAEIVRMVQQNPLPKDILLNVNIPDLPREEMGGPLITRQGLRIYRDALVRRADPRGVPYYWIGGEAPTGLAEEGTDIGALASGLVSITPIQLDLTAQQSLAALQKWNWFQLGPQA